MDKTSTTPTGITADRTARTLHISWADGHTSTYPYDGLRAVCPCVMCKGGHAFMGTPANPCTVRDTPATTLALLGIHQQGMYAIQLAWSDGHDTGIYTWQYLREADPANCRE
jgi:DUF971 family protein